MSKKQAILQKLINTQLYLFLRSHSKESLASELNAIRLSPEQISFLLKQHKIACDTSESHFLERLESNSQDIQHLYPVVIDPEPLHSSSDEQYAEMLNNARVAIVGPSESIVGSFQGSYIDSYDLVVRLNFGWPIPSELEKDIGTRMDILYHCCNGDYSIEQLLNQELSGLRCACYERNIDARLLRRYCDEHGLYSLDVSETYSSLRQSLGSDPNTGTVAISSVLSYNVRELYITGISFFQEPSHSRFLSDGAIAAKDNPSQSTKRIAQHLMEPQIRHCKNLFLKDSRVSVDETLRKILDSITE